MSIKIIKVTSIIFAINSATWTIPNRPISSSIVPKIELNRLKMAPAKHVIAIQPCVPKFRISPIALLIWSVISFIASGWSWKTTNAIDITLFKKKNLIYSRVWAAGPISCLDFLGIKWITFAKIFLFVSRDEMKFWLRFPFIIFEPLGLIFTCWSGKS